MKLGQVAHISLIVFLLLGFLIVAAPRSFAADDSNSGQLTQSQTVNPQLLSSTIGNLTEGSNNTQVNQLASQLQSHSAAGTTLALSQTLGQLQSLLNTQPGSQGVPDSLNSLLQSLTAGPNGISLDPNQLSNSLGLDSSNGLPSNMANQSPASQSSGASGTVDSTEERRSCARAANAQRGERSPSEQRCKPRVVYTQFTLGKAQPTINQSTDTQRRAC